MGLVPASYKVTARSVSRVLGDGRRQSDRSLKGHEADVRKGQPWAVNHHPGIVAVYELGRGPLGGSPRATAPYLGPRPGTIDRPILGTRREGITGYMPAPSRLKGFCRNLPNRR